MYTDKVKPYIEQHVDEKGNCTYTVLPDQVNTLLGYSHCLSATTFRDVLCKDQSTLLALDANVDSNQQTYFWIHFTTTFLLPEDHSDNGLTHYQWISHTGMGNYYDFYFTKDHPANLSLYFSNADNLCIRSLTGNIWVGSRDNTNPTHDWTVTNDKLRGLLTSSDGKPFVIEASTDPADSTSPSPTEPTQPSNNSDQPISTNTKNHNGSSWEDFNRNGAGSSWEAYLQQSQARASSSPSYQNKNNVRPNPSSPTSPSPASPDNNASQQNPTVDKETESKIALAIKLAQEGKSLDQIESATGFTEAQLNVIFSRLSQ